MINASAPDGCRVCGIWGKIREKQVKIKDLAIAGRETSLLTPYAEELKEIVDFVARKILH